MSEILIGANSEIYVKSTLMSVRLSRRSPTPRFIAIGSHGIMCYSVRQPNCKSGKYNCALYHFNCSIATYTCINK